MKEITLENPVVKATIFYIEEYNSIIIRQEARKGFNDIILTIDQLYELTVALRNELDKSRNVGTGRKKCCEKYIQRVVDRTG